MTQQCYGRYGLGATVTVIGGSHELCIDGSVLYESNDGLNYTKLTLLCSKMAF